MLEDDSPYRKSWKTPRRRKTAPTCWRMTRTYLTKLRSFHISHHGRILRIFWPHKIANETHLRRCKQEDMDAIITRRRWRWLGHILAREPHTITRRALQWTQDGKRKRGGPKTTRRGTVVSEMEVNQHSWGSLKWLSQGRQK